MIPRKQLDEQPETNILHISAMPQWFKFTVDHTDLGGVGTSQIITLCTLPIKAWIHAVMWQSSASWTGVSPATVITVSLGDQDDSSRWLAPVNLWTLAGGSLDVEDAIGLTPWCGDLSNTHDLRARFGVDGASEPDMDDITAGEMTFWFLLSSMNDGSAG